MMCGAFDGTLQKRHPVYVRPHPMYSPVVGQSKAFFVSRSERPESTPRSYPRAHTKITSLKQASQPIPSAAAGTPQIQVKKLLLDLLDRSACVCLVADYDAGEGTVAERVGIVSLSFAAYSREENITDAPPPDATYLSNMAVDLAFRRLGVATTLLAACDEVVRRNSPHARPCRLVPQTRRHSIEEENTRPAPSRRRTVQGWRACPHAQPGCPTRGAPPAEHRKTQLHSTYYFYCADGRRVCEWSWHWVRTCAWAYN